MHIKEKIKWWLLNKLLRNITIEYWFRGDMSKANMDIIPKIYIDGKTFNVKEWKRVGIVWGDKKEKQLTK